MGPPGRASGQSAGILTGNVSDRPILLKNSIRNFTGKLKGFKKAAI